MSAISERERERERESKTHSRVPGTVNLAIM